MRISDWSSDVCSSDLALAPILCAGVTTYKGIKETETRPGEWIAISGLGGLGHVAVQYAKAMGLHVVALDVAAEKLALARSLGADVAIDARAPDAAAQVIQATRGGAHAVQTGRASCRERVYTYAEAYEMRISDWSSDVCSSDLKGIKETETRPGEWIAISGLGGLGHVAVQYAKAMGLHVVALDVAAEKLALARSLGADVAIDARAPDAAAQVIKATGGGAHGVLVTAVSPVAFAQALGLVRRKGTISLVGLPPGDFATPIFDVVLKRITLRGSIVGGRKDLAEALAFAAERSEERREGKSASVRVALCGRPIITKQTKTQQIDKQHL